VGLPAAGVVCSDGSSPMSQTPRILGLSAVTLATVDMARAVRFYRALGFELNYGDEKG